MKDVYEVDGGSPKCHLRVEGNRQPLFSSGQQCGELMRLVPPPNEIPEAVVGDQSAGLNGSVILEARAGSLVAKEVLEKSPQLFCGYIAPPLTNSRNLTLEVGVRTDEASRIGLEGFGLAELGFKGQGDLLNSRRLLSWC